MILFQEIDNCVAEEVTVAVDKAKNDPEPSKSETFTEICTGHNNIKVRGCDAFSFHRSY